MAPSPRRSLGPTLLAVAVGCAPPPATTPGPTPTTPAAAAPPAPRCPPAPRLEWCALAPPRRSDGAPPRDDAEPLGWRCTTPLWLAGQVRSVDLEAFEGGQSLVGSLTAAGQRRMERGTRALALAAARNVDGPTPWVGVRLDGEVVAAIAARQTIRGRHFRVPTLPGWPPTDQPLEALGVRLRAAAAEDRACFASDGPAEPEGAGADATQKRFALEAGRR